MADKQIDYWAHMLDEALNKEDMLDEGKMTRQELDDFYAKLKSGIVKFSFIKKDGTHREATGTLNPSLMPSIADQRAQYDQLYKEDPEHNKPFDEMLQMFDQRKDYMIYFWDLEKNAYRQFHVSRFEGVDSFKQTSSRTDVQRLGKDTFVYTDRQSLDTFMTPSTIDKIDSDLEQAFPNGIEVMVAGKPIASSGQISVQYDRATSTPTLIYSVHLEQSIDDFSTAPLQLGINEVRKYILDTYGVKIAKVKIQSEVTYK